MLRVARLRALALGALWLTACATAPVLPGPEVRAVLAGATVVASHEQPAIEFEGFAHGRLEGAGIGASRTFLECLGGLGRGSCGGDFCGAFLILWLGLCTAATPVGGLVGAAIAPGAGEVQASEAQLHAALEQNALQESLRSAVLAAARADGDGWDQLGGESGNARVEVALTRVGTEDGGIDPPLLLYMTARARVLRAGEDTPLYEAEFRHTAGARKFSEWAAEGGAPLLTAVERGYSELGSRIFERLFVLREFPDREPRRSGLFRSAFGLAPLAPAERDRKEVLLPSTRTWPRVTSRRPTLRWERFPRPGDRAAEPDAMSRVANVRYDLRVAGPIRDTWNLLESARRAEIVYQRDGLSEPAHTLETSLEHGVGYLWSVRARFELDGHLHVTEWSGLHETDPFSTAPSPWWFRFMTP